MRPLVSILIPVFNRENLVGESIESAINQTYKNIEIVVIDNCSTDGTWQVLQEYALKDERIHIYQNSENFGPVRNWERCIEEAQGDYAKFLFSDDKISTNFVEETISLFDENIAFVLSPIMVFGENISFPLDNFKVWKEMSTQKYFENTLLLDKFQFPVSPGSALFRTKDLKFSLEIDIDNPLGLDFSKFGAGNDLLLYLNTAKNYTKICTAKNATAFFRLHDESFTIANRLNSYYEYAKFHFIKKNKPKLLQKFKTVLWLRKIRKLTDNKIYELIEGRIDLIYLTKQLLINLLKKIKL